MVWCAYCGKDQLAEVDEANGFTCCTGCGRVIDDHHYSSEVTFLKGADGSSHADGTFVSHGSTPRTITGAGRQLFGYQTDSHERTLSRGRNKIYEIAEQLNVRPRDDLVNAGHRLYTIAVQHSFTRGRRVPQVAAACLYIACRQENKPFLLIDFSDMLQINVYVLGAVFLQLAQLLRLDEHPIMQKPTDPSLFIHRFADKLDLGKKMHAVANTALRLVASMKRDWMNTGRKPSGICGAALWIAAHVHGFERSKREVVSVVHVCEVTLMRRLIEFEMTPSGGLTVEEFEDRAKALEQQGTMLPRRPKIQKIASVSSQVGESSGEKASGALKEVDEEERELLCEHKGTGATHFAHGLCRSCYEDFLVVSGGLCGGEDPPAFQRAERKRVNEEECIKDEDVNTDDPEAVHIGEPCKGKPGKKMNRQKITSSNEDSDYEETSARRRNGGRKQGKGTGRSRDMVKERDVRGRGRGRGRGRSKVQGLCSTSGESDENSSLEDRGVEERRTGKGNHRQGKLKGRTRRKRTQELSTTSEEDDEDLARERPCKRGKKETEKRRGRGPGGGEGEGGGGGGGGGSKRRGVSRPASIPEDSDSHNSSSGNCSESSLGPMRPEQSAKAREPVASSSSEAHVQTEVRLQTAAALNSKEMTEDSGAAGDEGLEMVLKELQGAADGFDSEKGGVKEHNDQQVAVPDARARGVENGSCCYPPKAGIPIHRDEPDSTEGNLQSERRGKEKVEGTPVVQDQSAEAEDDDEDDGRFSDIDDEELGLYINTEEEVKLKTMVWTELNKEYLEEQAMKKAALERHEAALKAAVEAAGTDSVAALAAAAAVEVFNRKKDRGRKPKAMDAAKALGKPGETAIEAAQHMLASKRLSSKVNYEALADLFGDSGPDPVPNQSEKPDADGDAEGNTNRANRPRTKKRVTFADEVDARKCVEEEEEEEKGEEEGKAIVAKVVSSEGEEQEVAGDHEGGDDEHGGGDDLDEEEEEDEGPPDVLPKRGFVDADDEHIASGSSQYRLAYDRDGFDDDAGDADFF
ncbi:hypothetical protein CBR_g31712 [Chara braunii]|uniref:Cyclin-like domain-containing protein n=1 Tax=Chara braunii TaxID=69332 RepID=A0A388JY46_CHABU|nr:hypothetical protein CBR_g31712 [Chara braunii]|eukprot:GBG62695.1 hypothetical protein CBR_g31712 [Chara braunii]